MSTLQLHRRRKFINSLVGGMKLGYREADDVPHIERNTIVMPYHKAGMTKEQDIAWMEALLTLCYSSLPANKPDLKVMQEKKLDIKTPLGMVYNFVCKHNHQLQRHGQLLGADEYIIQSYEMFCSLLDFPSQPPQAQALIMMDVISRMGWMIDTDFGFPWSISDEGRELYKKLHVVEDRYNSLRKAGDDNYSLALEIYNILFDDDKNEEEEDANESNSVQGKDDEEGQEAVSEGAGKSGQEGEGETGEQETEAGKESNPFDGIKASEIGTNQANSNILPKNCDGFVPLDNVDIDMTDVEEKFNHRVRDARECITTGLSSKVRNMLKVMSQAKYRGGHKKGKINKRSIASITTGNDRIFRKKEMKDVVDTSVMLLVDCSGSMSGSRYTHACAATAMLVDVMKKLHIPCAVQGFSFNYDEKNIQYIFKRANDFTSDGMDVLNRMCSSDVELRGNCDAESLLRGYKEIVVQKQKRKIMIVLSDGEPADSSHHSLVDADDALLYVCKDIEKEKRVELYGIGIETDCVKRYYTNHTVINRASELETKLLEVIKQSII